MELLSIVLINLINIFDEMVIVQHLVISALYLYKLEYRWFKSRNCSIDAASFSCMVYGLGMDYQYHTI